MSNSAYHSRRHQGKSIFLRLMLGLFIVLLSATVSSIIWHEFEANADEGPWVETSGKVLETRISIVGSRDRGQYRPGEIDYAVEARVSYQQNTLSREEWLRASPVFTNVQKRRRGYLKERIRYVSCVGGQRTFHKYL